MAKTATKTTEPEAKKPNAGLMKPVQPSPALAAIVGSTPMPRT